MRSQGAAHRVQVNRDTGRYDDRLGVKKGQLTGGPVDNEDTDQDDDGGNSAGFRAVVSAGHPNRTHGIALDYGRKLGEAAYWKSKENAHARVPGKVPTPADPERSRA